MPPIIKDVHISKPDQQTEYVTRRSHRGDPLVEVVATQCPCHDGNILHTKNYV